MGISENIGTENYAWRLGIVKKSLRIFSTKTVSMLPTYILLLKTLHIAT